MSLRTWLGGIGSIALAGALGCGTAHGGTGGGGPIFPDSDGGTNTNDGTVTNPGGLSCDSVCGRLAGSSCASAQANCMTTCQSSLAAAPAACSDSVNALGTCLMSAPISCGGGSPLPFQGCTSEIAAYTTCAAMVGPGLDGGVTPPRDTGVTPPRDTGVTPPRDTGTGGSACSQYCARVSSMCSIPASTCASACQSTIGSVPTSCASVVNTLIACTQTSSIDCSTFQPTSCASQLSAVMECAGIQPDSGTPPPVDSGGSDPCVGLSSCTTCIAGSTCGWCNGQCYNGTATGPNGATCSDAWSWTTCTTP